jgi:hypothetical protein
MSGRSKEKMANISTCVGLVLLPGRKRFRLTSPLKEKVDLPIS